MVAFATTISSLWILIANNWMQNPVGYEVIDGRAQMVLEAAQGSTVIMMTHQSAWGLPVLHLR